MSDFSIRWCILPSGERLPLLSWDGRHGVPDLSITRYTMTCLRPSRVPNSMEIDLRGIGIGVAFCSARGLDLVERIARGTFLTSDELTALHETMRRGKRKDIVSQTTASDRYHAFIRYIRWYAEPILARISERDDFLVAMRGLDDFRSRASVLGPNAENDAAKGNPGTRLGLTPEQRELFLRVIVPGAPENPFREDLQGRNYAILLSSYLLGWRAGEMLGVKIRDIDWRKNPVEVTIHRRHDDPEDTRKRQPASKTRARILAFDESLASAVETWIKQRSKRDQFPLARRHPYLFVNEDGEPFTHHGLSAIYERLRLCHSSLPKDLTTHVLRHDWNNRWVLDLQEQGVDSKEAERLQIHQMGWSDQTKMTSLYSQEAIADLANQKSVQLQRTTMKRK